MQPMGTLPQGATEDAILLVVSSGLCDFIRNTLTTIRRSGETSAIFIALPRNALTEVEAALADWPDVRYVLFEDICRYDFPWTEGYQNFGSEGFGRFTVAKWPAIRHLLRAGFKRVTYTDIDLAWMRNPLPLIRVALKVFEMAIQTDGTDNFPPHYCTGFMTYRNSDFSMQLLNHLEKFHLETVRTSPTSHDQIVFNHAVQTSRGVIERIFTLSELLFANGLLAAAMVSKDEEIEKITAGRVNPMIFHANWAVGTENKRRLLQRTGNWLIGNS